MRVHANPARVTAVLQRATVTSGEQLGRGPFTGECAVRLAEHPQDVAARDALDGAEDVLAGKLAVHDRQPPEAAVAELLASERSEKTIAEVIAPFKRPADRIRYSEGLRKAGLPEE